MGGFPLNRTIFVTALATLLVAGLVFVAWQFAWILLLAFAGVLLAILLRQLAHVLGRHTPIPIGMALMVIVIILVLVAIIFFVLAGPRITSELKEVVESLPKALDDLQSYIQQTTYGGALLNSLSAEEQLADWNIVSMLGGTVSTALGLVTDLIVLFTVAVFLSVDPDLYRRGFIHLVPKDRRKRAGEVLDALERGLWRWLLGQSIDMVAVAFMTGFGLWVIGLPVPVALGLIAGLTNFIPYLGPFLGGIPATLIAFSVSPSHALYAAGLFLAIQQIEGNVLMPMIQKRATSLPPVLTILAVVGLGSVFGILGALLATPLTLVVIIVVRMLYVEDMLGDQTGNGP